MKIIVQTLDKKTFEFDGLSEETSTVMDLKMKIQDEKNHPADQMKLIFSGKVLDDNNKKLVEYAVADASKIVLLLQKSKPVVQPTPAPKTEEQPTKPEVNADAQKEDEPKKEENQPAPATTNTNVPQNLFSLASQQAQNGGLAAPNEGEDEVEMTEEELMQAIQENPQMLLQVLMASPQIQQMAQQNPAAVQQMMNDPSFINNIMQLGQQMQEEEQLYNKVFDGKIDLTEEQKAEVEEIVAMGFGTYEEVVQFYIAFDHNKEMTVNHLLNEQLDSQQ